MHKTSGQRDPAAAFPLPVRRDDREERRQANRAIAVSAAGLAGDLPGVIHAHARARWTGRFLRIEVEAWVDPGLIARDADALGRRAADAVSRQVPDRGSFTWSTRAAPP
jgi:divalent metal cation (Fe/Co/Zn/Cd) transporter